MTSTIAKPTIVNGAWLTRQEFAALHYIVYGIIPEGVTLLVAPPKAGKSWLVLAIAIARASGGVVLGQQITAGPVLYLALEDGHRRLQDRALALLAPGEEIPADLDFIISMGTSSVIETIRDWISEHHGQNPLVIIDTFGRVKPPARAGASAYDHDYSVMAALKQLVDDEPGSGMVVVHHDRKAASEDFVDAVSGTHGIAGAADTTVVIRRPRTEDGAVLCVTGRDVTEAEYAAVFKAGHWSLAATDLASARRQAGAMKAAAGLGDRSTRIIDLAASRPEGIRAKDVSETEGMTQQNAGEYLRRLAEKGRLRNPHRGLYTPVENVESVENAEDEGEHPLADSTHPTLSVEVEDQPPPAFSTLSTHSTGVCLVCREPMVDTGEGFTTHPNCGQPKTCGHTGRPSANGKCGTCIAETKWGAA